MYEGEKRLSFLFDYFPLDLLIYLILIINREIFKVFVFSSSSEEKHEHSNEDKINIEDQKLHDEKQFEL